MDKITSNIYHLDRAKLYETEKPFNWSAELACLPGLPGSNHVFTSQTVNINNVRGCTPPSLDTQGFEFVKSTTSLKPEDFDNDNLIQTTFYSEIEKVLFEQLPDVTAVAFLGHQVRKRSTKFPREEGALVPAAQPQTMAHVDLTMQGGKDRLQVYFKDNPELEKRPWQMLNVWRVLKGPSNDWPLALCDYRSVDVEHDTVANDIVVAHGDGYIENSLLYFNEKHQWFYKSDMDVDDLIIFRQTDSSGAKPSEKQLDPHFFPFPLS
ncbi:methyltransferase, partial [Metarhizium brunneum ARSEF 3297]